MRSPQVDFGISAYTLVCANSYRGYITFSRFGVLGSQRTSRYTSQLGARYSAFAGAGRAFRLQRVARPSRRTPASRGDDIAGGWSTVDASTPTPRPARCDARDGPRTLTLLGRIVASRRFARGRRGDRFRG